VGTAQPGQDYVPLAGTVILPEGQTSVTVTFQSIQKDVVFEPTDMIVAIWPVRVGQVYIKQGNAVTAGEPLVDLTVPQESVTLQASPSDLTQLAVGQSCTMTISGGQSTLDGVITELDSNPTNISSSGGSGGGSGGGGGQEVFEGQIEVSGGLSKADQNADGATVSITVTTQEVKNALSVPVAAVLQNGSGQDVVRLVELSHGGEIREVPITTGLTAGSYVQIKGGLHAGQVVLVSINQNQS
jgi:multidrug efflux pump subunit AcrA (membrane-fusion protein)